MQLPEWLNIRVWQELETIEEKENMQYITSAERIGIVKGKSGILNRQFSLPRLWRTFSENPA